MQTSKWGPPGWVLLHKITSKYNPSYKTKEYTHKHLYKQFFNHLKHMLPCKYCRESYTQYITELPIDSYLVSRKKMMEWLYLIHNKVNDKLRKQGLLNKKDPSFESIYKKYDNMCDCKVTCIAWDFIYSIVFNYHIEPDDKSKKNYEKFFILLAEILPSKRFKNQFKTIMYIPCGDFGGMLDLKQALKSRYNMIYWFYSIHKRVLNKMVECGACKRVTSFQTVYKKYEDWRAKCANKTCRKRPTEKEITDNIVKLINYKPS